MGVECRRQFLHSTRDQREILGREHVRIRPLLFFLRGGEDGDDEGRGSGIGPREPGVKRTAELSD